MEIFCGRAAGVLLSIALIQIHRFEVDISQSTIGTRCAHEPDLIARDRKSGARAHAFRAMHAVPKGFFQFAGLPLAFV